MYDLRDILTAADTANAETLLHSQGLALPDDVEYGMGVYDGETLIATGFLGAGRLMGLCVDPAWRNEGLSLTVVDHLLHEAVNTGTEHLFIFTKAAEAHVFAGMGFSLLAEAFAVPVSPALLEWGQPDFAAWLRQIPRLGNAFEPSGDMVNAAAKSAYPVGAVVLNANPCTLGHVALLEWAAAQCRHLYAFVVEENKSAFPFEERLRLVREGMAHVPNCHVLPSGAYIISQHTFPSYFTGQEGHAAAHAALDAQLFAQRIAPALTISARFVGTEPFSSVTNLYNHTLQTILPQHGIAVQTLPRVQSGSVVISASRVRSLLAQGSLRDALALVPPPTAQFLCSPSGKTVIHRLQQTKGYADAERPCADRAS